MAGTLPQFYLGTHLPRWLEQVDVPLCVSRRRLADRKTLPQAKGPWMLDSGGFTELTLHGRWTTEPREFVADVRRCMAEIGNLEWVAVQDWMCEPGMRERTGLTVAEHQLRTVVSYLELRLRAPELPWMPVLQGWDPTDYLAHVELYTQAGVDLAQLGRVGLGSVCRRQHTWVLDEIVTRLEPLHLPLHGFGVKLQGLAQVHGALASADSLAWSLDARNRPALPGCHHANCGNCLTYALSWRARVLRQLEQQAGGRQMRMALH